MLDLESLIWKELGTFFGESESLPQMLKNWENAVGTVKEEELWREIYDCVCHQETVESAAFAVVPHLVNKLGIVSNERKIEYVIDLGFVELARQDWGDKLPQILLADYENAIKESRKYAIESLALVTDKITFRYLLGAISTLFNHPKLGNILFHLDCLGDECPQCKEYVYPSEIQESEYI